MKENLQKGGEDGGSHLTGDNLINFKGIIYVPNIDEIKRLVMKEFHLKPYSVQPGYQKTLTTIKRYY